MSRVTLVSRVIPPLSNLRGHTHRSPRCLSGGFFVGQNNTNRGQNEIRQVIVRRAVLGLEITLNVR